MARPGLGVARGGDGTLARSGLRAEPSKRVLSFRCGCFFCGYCYCYYHHHHYHYHYYYVLSTTTNDKDSDGSKQVLLGLEDGEDGVVVAPAAAQSPAARSLSLSLSRRVPLRHTALRAQKHSFANKGFPFGITDFRLRIRDFPLHLVRASALPPNCGNSCPPSDLGL